MDFPSVPDVDKIPPEILARALAEAEAYPGRDTPYWIQVMGIPGAGKTLFVEALAKRLSYRAPYALAANDVFLVQLPAYQAMADKALAFETHDGTARAIAFSVFKELTKRRADVIYEHSTVYPAVRDLVKYVKHEGYALFLVRITVPLAVAKKRARAREREIGRHVPEYVIEERVPLVEERWAELTPIAHDYVQIENDESQSPEEVFGPVLDRIDSFVRALH